MVVIFHRGGTGQSPGLSPKMWLGFQAQHLPGKGLGGKPICPWPSDNTFLASTSCPQVKERFLVRIFGSQII